MNKYRVNKLVVIQRHEDGKYFFAEHIRRISPDCKDPDAPKWAECYAVYYGNSVCNVGGLECTYKCVLCPYADDCGDCVGGADVIWLTKADVEERLYRAGKAGARVIFKRPYAFAERQEDRRRAYGLLRS